MLPRNSKSAPLANISCHFPAQSNVMNLWFIMNIGLCDKNNSLCWRPYRVECTGSLPTSEVKRRRARLVLGWGTAREDLRVLPAFDSQGFVTVTFFGLWFLALMSLPASRPVLLPPSPLLAPSLNDTVCIWRPYEWIPFGDHPLKLERYRED